MTIVFEKGRISAEALPPGPSFPEEASSRRISAVLRLAQEPPGMRNTRVPRYHSHLGSFVSDLAHATCPPNPSAQASPAPLAPSESQCSRPGPKGLARCGEWALAQKLCRSQPLRPDAGWNCAYVGWKSIDF